jgi:glucan 1,3-beta-glucosidase
MAFPRFLNVVVLIYIGRAVALVADFSKGDVAVSAASSSESTTDLTVAPAAAAPAASSGWTLLGCYTDNVSARSLPYGAGVPGGPSAMTNELCQSTCLAAGYTLAGTEYSDECCEYLS